MSFKGILSEESKDTRAYVFPNSFRGITIEYHPNVKYIKVVTSRGGVMEGCIVQVNQTSPFSTTTDSKGIASGLFDSTGTIPITLKSGNTFYEFSIDTANQPLVSTLVFPLDYL